MAMHERTQTGGGGGGHAGVPSEHLAVIVAAVAAALGRGARVREVRPAVISRAMSGWMRAARESAPHRRAPVVGGGAMSPGRTNPRPKGPALEYP